MTFGRFTFAAWIAAGLLMFAGAPAAMAQDIAMTFKMASTGQDCLDCRWIAAHGDLVGDSDVALSKFLKSNSVDPGTTVRFDSAGGSLEASMVLGRMIRARGLRTAVGGTHFERASAKGVDIASRTKGMCASACAYAFLGGMERSVDPGSRLGVHQFYTGSGRRNRGSDATAQSAIADIARFMEQMGVSSGMIVAAAITPPTDMNWLTRKEMETFHAITDIATPAEAEWAFGQNADALYLVSRQTQKNGSVTEFRLTCSVKSPQMIQFTAQRPAPLLPPDRYDGLSKAVVAAHFNHAEGDIHLAGVEADADGVRIEGEVSRGAMEALVLEDKAGLAVDLEIRPEFVAYLGGASHLFPMKNLKDAMPVLLRNCSDL